MVDRILLHGSCLSVAEAGILLLGAPGSGKSDLALRLIDQPGCGISGIPKPARLVADDQVMVRLEAGKLIASAPPVIAGLIEIRGLGLLNIAQRAEVALAIVVQLDRKAPIERMPDMEKNRYELMGTSLPMLLIDPALASAPARIRAAVDWLEQL